MQCRAAHFNYLYKAGPCYNASPDIMSSVSHSSRSRNSPSTRRPRHTALLIGITYTYPPEDLDYKDRPQALKGPANDVKEFKSALIGRSR
jgi:hypothetical protein